jgi:hypothetical protein
MKNDESPKSNPKESASPKSPKRISTQIHRRNKAKAVYPLKDEWEDSTSDVPPSNLRTPSDKMKKS